MAKINEAETSKLVLICQDARVVDARRCQPILCASENPEAGIAPQIPFPILGKGDVCIATMFYSTGHSSPDCSTDQSKMYMCPYRRSQGN